MLKSHRLDDMFRVQSYFEFCFSMRSLNDNLILQKQESIILKAYEIIMPNLDQDRPNESFAMSYMAYGLFGVLIRKETFIREFLRRVRVNAFLLCIR